jgi:hypothetical protein
MNLPGTRRLIGAWPWTLLGLFVGIGVNDLFGVRGMGKFPLLFGALATLLGAWRRRSRRAPGEPGAN